MAGLLSKIYVKAVDATKKKNTELKLLSRRELRAVLKLFYKEGWVDFTLSDLEFMYRVSPKTCFKFVSDNEMVGVTFALQLENGVCYPNSSIIAEEHRKKVKYHSEVLKYSEYLKDIAKFEVMYSAKWLVDLYRDGMGYQAVADIKRVKVKPAQDLKFDNQLTETLTADNAVEVADFLSGIYNSERQSLIQHVLKYGFKGIVHRSHEGAVDGFAMIRELPKYQQIGPVISRDSSIAIHLIKQLIAEADASVEHADIILDGDAKVLPPLLEQHGLAFEWEGTEMVKMIRGDESLREDESAITAIYSHYLS